MDLFLLRHGIAVEREEWEGDDRERPLSEDGVSRMQAEAKTMASLGLGLERVVCSPFTRARQTAEIVAKTLGLTNALAEDERLEPGFDSVGLERILRERRGLKTLMLVGHEPDLSRIIGKLTGARVEFKSGSLARIGVPDPQSPKGTLLWLLPPGALAIGRPA